MQFSFALFTGTRANASHETMKPLVAILALAFTTAIYAADFNSLSAEDQAAGWRLLFNGKDLTGWHQYGKKTPTPPGEGWKVEDGLLKKLPKVRGGDIITEAQYEDYELDWEWRLAPGANNGLKYLVTEARTSGPGHEYQMIDDKAGKDVAAAKRKTASFYDVLAPAANKPLKDPGQWNTSRILIKGNHVEHWLNGAKVLAYELGSAELLKAVAESKFKKAAGFGTKIKGHIMLTDHGDEAWFRNIKIRELK
jgi:hypothetical protein